MKNFLFGLMLTVGSVSAFATCINPSSLDIEVCADVLESSKGLVITNISPKLQVKGSVAKDLCETFGNQLSNYQVKVTKTKSCYYFATKGFFAGGMVEACNDFGGLFQGKVFSKIRCIEKK